RPNVMIKIPATAEGIPAIEEAIASGLNINVTLIFSKEVYEQVAEAYIRGLERLAASGKPVNRTGSVASFFVSRIDTAVEKELTAKLNAATDQATKDRISRLFGKVAIANAKLAYQSYKNIFHGERFAKLRAQGAMPQRQLWASTSTKNPKYRDVIYVEELIGPETVDTVPPQTFNAFRDHGRPRLSLEENIRDAEQTMQELAAATDHLQKCAGVAACRRPGARACRRTEGLCRRDPQSRIYARGGAGHGRLQLVSGSFAPHIRPAERLARAASARFHGARRH